MSLFSNVWPWQISFLFSATSGVQSEFLSHTMWQTDENAAYRREEVAPLYICRLICHRAKGEVLLTANELKINFK